MATRSRKRQKTDPSPVKPNHTLFHFFSKPNLSNGGFKSEASPPKTESDTSSICDEPRRKSNFGAFGASSNVKMEMTPPRMATDEIPRESEVKTTQFEASFTEADDTCSPTKEDIDDIDPFDGLEFPYEEPQDEDFRDEELDYIDDIEDDFDETKRIKSEPLEPPLAHSTSPTSAVKSEPPDPSIDDGPSCPFCNFSFKGLTENVPSPSPNPPIPQSWAILTVFS